MIYHLAEFLKKDYLFFNLFHYVSVRAIFSLLSSLILFFILGNWFIKASQRNFRSNVREYTPQEHQKKNSTPTMGGLLVLLITTINILFWNNLSKLSVWIFLLCLLSFGLIGFVDDWAKINSKKGISAKSKFQLQILFAVLFVSIWYFFSTPNTQFCLPFFKNAMFSLGLFIIPWAVFTIVSTSNAVNLTDGLDGLATGPLITNFAAFSIICYLAGHKQFANYLYIPFADSSELSIIGASLIGSLIGFLWYNTYPAQIFMGDVGSLSLGAALAFMAIVVRQEFLLLVAGGIFVIETLSVIIQVASFKWRGKRVFKMAPIHHHFELIGWSEPKITIRFWIISLILSILALLLLKVR
ncbi:TPA: phospho-N-acetylmuramoyl-pentapeptide-transferase [Candidatus Dependentiae bacterium]|nr:phospho-N-acetylmuramoyl-pentapeptide-transferase [Candidatus Dependentiae bacterium]HBZ73807.1 phospho-N-acetylmuramoyl-pentapeptide-transferase [Candidatus Dependentiae bacterium]